MRPKPALPGPRTSKPPPATAPDRRRRPTAATPPAPGKISPADFVARYANVQLEQGSPVTTEADVFGGEGYRH